MALVVDRIPQDRAAKVRLYGHSLGAACAVVIAHLLALRGHTSIECYALSCPAVFKPDCAVLKGGGGGFGYTHWYTKTDPVVEDTGRLGGLKLLTAYADFGRACVLYGSKRDNRAQSPPPMHDDDAKVIDLRPHGILYVGGSALVGDGGRRKVLFFGGVTPKSPAWVRHAPRPPSSAGRHGMFIRMCGVDEKE